MISIELDEKTKREIAEQAKAQLFNQLMAQFSVNQIGAEIRNKAINEAAKMLAARMWETVNAERHINRAIASVQDRLNSKLHEKLAKGINVTFNDL